MNIVGYNTKCHICIFPTFQEKQKTEFLAWEWFVCLKNLTSVTEYDKKWYLVRRIVLSSNLMKFQCSLNLIEFQFSFGIFFLKPFSSAADCLIDKCSHKILKSKSPSILFLNKVYLTHYDWRSKAVTYTTNWTLLLIWFDNFDLCFLWFLIG